MKCAVINCNKSNEGKSSLCSFFRFPKNEALRKKWISFCGRRKFNPDTSFVCMDHFKPEDFANNLQYEMGFASKRLLMDGVVPTVKLVKPKNKKLFEERASRSERRENKKTVDLLLKNHRSAITPSNENCPVRSIENINTYNTENTYEIENQPPEEQSLKISSLDVDAQSLKVKSLQDEILILKKEKNKSDAELKIIKEKMDKMEKKHKYEKDEMEKNLAKARFELTCIEEKLQIIFTTGQIKKLKNGIKRQTWSEDDIAHSITLYAVSPKMYKLMYKNQFPLPAVRTLQSWAQKLEITRGLIKPVFKILQSSYQMTQIEKLCVLSFDEMKIRSSYCYDRETDTTLAPVNYVQVGMLRGLMSKWKQPIYYDFDCPMTKEIIESMLHEVKQCGFTVVAMVSDLGGANRSLIKELQITEEKPWFLFNDEKIFSFADVPHLIKLLRNHFIDEGFIIDGKDVKKDIIFKLLEETSADLSITHKISNANLTVTGAKRQRVKLATKLFSHTVAQAITRTASLGHLGDKNWAECHKLFKTTNDWFDVMNVKVPKEDSRTRRHGYGLALDEQDKILDEMSALMMNMRAIGSRSLLPFQKGILQSNNALKGLYADLKKRYSLKYVLTYRLNQDVLENFFGVIRAKGGLHDHPDQQEFKYRLRSYLLGRNNGVLSDAANVEVDDTPDLEASGKSLTGIILTNIKFDDETVPSDEQEIDDLPYDGLENFAGYICHKLKNAVPDIAEPENTDALSFTWVDHLSEGGLSKPTPEMMAYIKGLESVFNSINENDLLITNNFLKFHLQQAQHIKCSEKIKKLFFRARMYCKIRILNREISNKLSNRKRKWNKILN